MQLRVTNAQAALIVAFISTGLLFFALGRLSGKLLDIKHDKTPPTWATVPSRADTLVVYTYANRDWEYPRNIAFFFQHGGCLEATIGFRLCRANSSFPAVAPVKVT